MPKILVFAGPNGSGKTTITSNIQCFGQYVNADDIKVDLGCTDLEAAQIADRTREYLLEQKMDFTFETVMSTLSKIDFLAKAKKAGYHLSCIYILTSDPSVNIHRVEKRVAKGGHNVPKDKIVNRYKRSLSLIPQLVALCDELYIFDNTSETPETNKIKIVESINGVTSVFPNGIWNAEMLELLISGKYASDFLSRPF